MLIRAAAPADFAAVQAIYARHVLAGLATFDEAPPEAGALRARHDEIVRAGLPYRVAERDGEIVGFGYCAPYRARSAYRYCVEDSVYVRDGLRRQGIGKALLGDLIAASEGAGCRQLVAVIGDSANADSIGLHAHFGFLVVGTLRSAGFKLGRWVDCVIMQRPLGGGDASPPGAAADPARG